MSDITVVEVFRSLSIEPQKHLTWRVGQIMQAEYRMAFGDEVPKKNRPKTCGSGKHAMACYPMSWKRKIAKVIRQVAGTLGTAG